MWVLQTAKNQFRVDLFKILEIVDDDLLCHLAVQSNDSCHYKHYLFLCLYVTNGIFKVSNHQVEKFGKFSILEFAVLDLECPAQVV